MELVNSAQVPERDNLAKKELDVAKKELAAKIAITEAHQTQLKKDAQTAKATLRTENEKLTSKCDSLVRVGETNKSKICDRSSLLFHVQPVLTRASEFW